MNGYGSGTQRPRYLAAMAGFGLCAAMAQPAAAQDPKYAFMAPPDHQSVRLYRVNGATGEMGACHYEAPKDNTQLGAARCLPAGPGAGPQAPGRYELRASNHTTEGGVFRVNTDTGEISVCWARGSEVVCTPPSR